jgi:hypothetical protein
MPGSETESKAEALQTKLLLEFAAWKRKVRKRYASFVPLRKKPRGESVVKPKTESEQP